MTEILLDISRLISRVRHVTPSGVDRVEMAYARGLLRLYGDRLSFVAVHPTGRYGQIDRTVALSYLEELSRRWNTSGEARGTLSLPAVLPWMVRLLPRSAPRRKGGRPVYVQTSPHHLVRQQQVERILARENARFLCMVHDLIPIEYPEYARPDGGAQHSKRMATVAACADAVVCNSTATSRSFQPWIDRSGRQIATHVALLGTEPVGEGDALATSDDRPYFICLGTIEPRKNHLLLLNLWRQFAATLPHTAIPRLVIIGRRGWENEQVLDMLDRCPALAAHVEEVPSCSDRQLATLLRGARALVMPSFAEGFGMPVAEALSVGVPVICSDIPAHHEVGRAAPDFIDPLDGLRWQTTILDHAARGYAWQSQMARMDHWRAPTWDEHMRIVEDAIDALSVQ